VPVDDVDVVQIKRSLQEIVYRVVKIFNILEPESDSDSDSEYDDDSSYYEMDSDFSLSFEISDLDSGFGVGTDSKSSSGGKPKPIADTKPKGLPKQNSLKLLKSIGQKLSKN
jgi:hypothetical protein